MEYLSIVFQQSRVETYIFVPPLVSFVISFFTSMAGVSGAFLILPFQMSVLGFTSPSVSATNLLYNVTGTPGGIYRYNKEKRLFWPIAVVMVAGIIPGVLIGYVLRVKYLPDPKAFNLFVGIVLLYIAGQLLKDIWFRKSENISNNSVVLSKIEKISVSFKRTRFHFNGKDYSFTTIGLLILSFIVGIIGGVYGIGGGAIIAPFCITVFKLPVHAIAGATLFGTFVSSLFGIIFYSVIPIHGMLSPPDWSLGMLFGLGGLLGTYFGAKMQKKVSEKWIKLVLGLIVVIVASKYIYPFIV